MRKVVWNAIVRMLCNSLPDTLGLLRRVGGETFLLTSSSNQGDASAVYRVVRSRSPVGVVGCGFFYACFDEISWCLGSPLAATSAK